jgi:phospholipase/lecithinase/hemolysin
MQGKMRRWTMITLLGCVLGAPGLAAAQKPLAGLVVFGTSLSDPGNAFALFGATNTPPDWSVDPFLVPDRPYARGGQHFSNGATWIEQYAGPRGLSASAQPAFRDAGAKAANYAVGGARARETGIFHLSSQVSVFLTHVGGAAPGDALYVIEMGGNDLRDALQAGPGGGTVIVEDAIKAIAASIGTLYAAGARKFLVWNAPDLGLTPAIRAFDALFPGAAAAATGASELFNFHLDFALGMFEADLPGIHFTRLDVFQKLRTVVDTQENFRLTNVTTGCITPGIPPFACRNPDKYLFWDGIHPTRAAHAILAHEAAAVLGQ